MEHRPVSVVQMAERGSARRAATVPDTQTYSNFQFRSSGKCQKASRTEKDTLTLCRRALFRGLSRGAMSPCFVIKAMQLQMPNKGGNSTNSSNLCSLLVQLSG